MSEHLTPALLDDLASRLLTREELESVYEHVADCRECEDALRGHMGLLNRVRSSGPGPSSLRRGSWNRGLSKAAWGVVGAAAVLLIALLLPHRGPEYYWLPEAGPPVVTRSEASALKLNPGIKAYKRRDAAEAAKLLEPLHLQGGSEALRRLYLASAYVNSGKAEKALETLPSPRQVPLSRRSQVEWLRFLALESSGRSAAADSLLLELATLENEIGNLAKQRLED